MIYPRLSDKLCQACGERILMKRPRDEVKMFCSKTCSIHSNKKHLIKRPPTVKLGNKFSKLMVISNGPSMDGNRYFLCQCDCGSEPKLMKAANLVSGNSKSCGCVQNKIRSGEIRHPVNIGEQFGKLTVLSEGPRSERNNSKQYWCQCNCGSEPKLLLGSSLTLMGSKGVKSCGCTKKWINTGEVLAAELKKYKHSADERNYQWELTQEQFNQLVQSDCHYCDAQPNFPIGNKQVKLMRNGIDRINNDIGYVFDNCVPCCKLCNMMKLTYSKQKFIEHCIRVANFQEEKALQLIKRTA